uniref:Ig-like domain-containing protein n=1 Tax=Sinocyclocheilus grahami TaxID=75366 RepID=A0A672LVP3_SINGR
TSTLRPSPVSVIHNLSLRWRGQDLLSSIYGEEQRVFGAEVDMRVKAGDSITLYCDCVIPSGSIIVWFRNCSHEHQPSLFIDSSEIFKEKFPRFSFVFNSSRNSYDLHITNVSVSDEGMYYCAKRERKVRTGVHGIINPMYEYEYGNMTTRLSVLGEKNLSIYLSILFCEQQRVFGAEVDMRVKAGDSITLYCDCVIPSGSIIVWFRNCSHEHQPSLFIDSSEIFKEKFPRFSFVFNSSRNSYDLHITNKKLKKKTVQRSDFSVYSEVRTKRT